MENLQGTTLGQYRLNALIGRGNRASVYQATKGDGGQTVAVRVFDRDLSADPAFAGRFRELAGTLSAVRHPNLLPVTEYDEQDGRALLVRPFVAGGSLRRLLGATMPLPEALRVLRPIAAALDYAHRQGLVHGDVKPGNILLPRSGPPLLVDLGIAQLLPRGNSLLMTATGRYYGTPEYLSPEQAHELALDGLTDEYALGVVLYEALTGRPPFRAESAADTPRAVAARHITATPPTPRAINPALGRATEEALLRALAKDPERRFPSCGDLIAALEEAAESATMLLATEVPPRPAMPEPDTQDAVTALLPADVAAPEGAPDDATRELGGHLAARHDAEMAALRADYAARLAAQEDDLRVKETTIATLIGEVAAAKEEGTRLAARLRDLEEAASERDALAERVRELESRAPVEPPASAPAGPDRRAAAKGPVGMLTILDPQQYGLPDGASFAVRPGATVGRHPESAVRINDQFVSAQHARLIWEAESWWLTDLGTKNGTYVNGARIKGTTRLNTGDAVRFGRVRASFA